MLQEILLDVVSFVDYATLVMLKLSDELLRFVDRHAEKLAVRRTLMIECTRNKWKVSNAVEWWLGSTVVINVDPNDTERAAALVEVKAIIGPHVVQRIGFFEAKIPIRSFNDAIPGARNALDISFYELPLAGQRYLEDILQFLGAKRANLDRMPLDALVAFMNNDRSSKVTWLSATPPLYGPEGTVRPDDDDDDDLFVLISQWKL